MNRLFLGVNEMPKVMLIMPPEGYPVQVFNLRFNLLSIPVGLLSIASYLKSKGIEVSIYDSRVDIDIVSLEGVSQDYFGASPEKIKQKIKMYQPDIIGISSLYTIYQENAFLVAKIAKEVNKNILTIIGGPNPSFYNLDVLKKCPELDICVIGEGEYTLYNLIESLQKIWNFKDVPSISYRDKGEIKTNRFTEPIKDLDSLPLLNYDLLDLEKYFMFQDKGYYSRFDYVYPGSERSISMVTSRGCPYKCIFCARFQHMGRTWRFHSPEYVANSIERLVRNYKVNHIFFEDDCINLDPKRFEEILDIVIRKGIKFTWSTPNGTKADLWSENLIKKCKISQATYLKLAFESGSQNVMDRIVNKKLNISKAINYVKTAHKEKIDLQAFFMIGFPGETKREIIETVKFILKLKFKYNVLPSLSIAAPFPGTPMWQIVSDKGYLKPKGKQLKWSKSPVDSVIETEEFSYKFLVRISNLVMFLVIADTIIKSFIFLFIHPVRSLKLIFYTVIKKTLKNPRNIGQYPFELIFLKLQYKNCMMMNFNNHSKNGKLSKM